MSRLAHTCGENPLSADLRALRKKKRATDRVRLGLAAAKRSCAEIQFAVTQVENRLLPEPILTNAIQIEFACAAIRTL
ncbi:hypothetical protein GCM10011363_27010 [Marivita lacus]|uniref:Uncharacterized protein n=1 Tax=Marivita lacus TaxID=1323742 RepID=A0ABQ1KVM6_9RHOB|nr:hypothetical protein [Marivita lacus]GGC08983.1 hypothetical protein GCM10011363_27010 [Marivita lacus]